VLEQVVTALLLGLILFSTALLLTTFGYQLWFAGRVFPGVRVANVDVSGLSTGEAALKLTRELAYPLQGRILLQYGDNAWMATPAELGLSLDPQASADAAYRLGRQGGLFANLLAQFRPLPNGQSLAPVVRYDESLAYQYLTTLAGQIDLPAVEASLKIEGTDVLVQPGKEGRYVDVYATLALLRPELEAMRDAILPLQVVQQPPAILDASEQADIARKILSEPLELSLPDGQPDSAGPWTLDRNTLASLLTISRVQDGDAWRYQVGLNSASMVEYLSRLAPDLKLSPQNARFIFNDDTRQLEVIQPAVIGRALDVDASLRSINDHLAKGDHTVALQFVFTDPQITNSRTGEELGIRELVHAETSYFRGSGPARIQNITAAAAKFHGLLVAPGETFSMANALGDISLDNGYAEALIILGDQTIKGVGGGVCQVSTTLFRAAFFAGFPIVERHAHAYRVGYYEQNSAGHSEQLAGLDATVFVPIVDFKFVNDTPYWLLMETYVNPRAGSLTWKFYSTADGRSVEMTTTGPVNRVPAPDPEYRLNPELQKDEIKQVDWAAEGADITVDRTVYRNGAVYIQDSFFTHYLPWKDVFEYGPGTDVPTPDKNNG